MPDKDDTKHTAPRSNRTAKMPEDVSFIETDGYSGTVEYISPEEWDCKLAYVSDVWAIGYVLILDPTRSCVRILTYALPSVSFYTSSALAGNYRGRHQKNLVHPQMMSKVPVDPTKSRRHVLMGMKSAN